MGTTQWWTRQSRAGTEGLLGAQSQALPLYVHGHRWLHFHVGTWCRQLGAGVPACTKERSGSVGMGGCSQAGGGGRGAVFRAGWHCVQSWVQMAWGARRGGGQMGACGRCHALVPNALCGCIWRLRHSLWECCGCLQLHPCLEHGTGPIPCTGLHGDHNHRRDWSTSPMSSGWED